MKVSIDKETCIGCGSCVAVCPDCFEMGEDNKPILKGGGETCDDPCVKEVEEICPVDAIKVEE